MIADQKNKSVAKLWDGEHLKISFRRRVSPRLMRMWHDLTAIVESVNFTDDCDSIIWAFDGSSKFSVQAVYKTISFRGIQPVFTPSIWSIVVPPRIHIFLWLLSNNKILTRDNLAKRRNVEDYSCLFCSQQESVCHLFFDCVVAKTCWSYLVDIFHVDLGSNFESVARWWVSNNRYKVMNCCSAALMWCLWKTRNEICFQGKVWLGEKLVIRRLANTLKNWRILFAAGDWELLDQVLASLHAKLVQPLAILGPSLMGSLRSSSLEASTSPSAPSLGSIISNVVLPVTSEAAARVVLPFAEVGEGVLANLATALNFDPPLTQ